MDAWTEWIDARITAALTAALDAALADNQRLIMEALAEATAETQHELKKQLREEMKSAIIEQNTQLREEAAKLRVEISRLEVELTRSFAQLETKQQGLRLRGAYRSSDEYSRLDVIHTEDGSSFIARCDAPGVCPGPNWQLLASVGLTGAPGPSGARGQRGLRGIGERGPAGEPGVSIETWKVEGYTITPIMSDGSAGPPLNMRALFAQFNEGARLP
jgi:hypothetical protein